VAQSRLINRNINAGRGRTSMRLEPELWEALEEICESERISMRDLVRRIEQTEHASGRTSAVRVYIVDYFRSASYVSSRARPMAAGAMAMSAP
jgi:predicted DNA-binding ribbon-helix-helix protein